MSSKYDDQKLGFDQRRAVINGLKDLGYKVTGHELV